MLDRLQRTGSAQSPFQPHACVAAGLEHRGGDAPGVQAAPHWPAVTAPSTQRPALQVAGVVPVHRVALDAHVSEEAASESPVPPAASGRVKG